VGRYSGVVFDLDGTLVDSRLDFAAMRAETGCPAGTGLLEYIDQLESEHRRQAARAAIHRHEMAGAAAATWMPGAESLLKQLQRGNRPVGIFTRNSREAATRVIEALGIPCDALIAREDAAAKPDPEGLVWFYRRWDLRPEELLMVGDYLYDLQAARHAGACACLYDPAGDSPHAAHADLVVRHFRELSALLFDAST